jgi:hypothetical protein
MGFVRLTASVAIRRPARTARAWGFTIARPGQGNVERNPAAPPRTWDSVADTLASERFVETAASHRKRESPELLFPPEATSPSVRLGGHPDCMFRLG